MPIGAGRAGMAGAGLEGPVLQSVIVCRNDRHFGAGRGARIPRNRPIRQSRSIRLPVLRLPAADKAGESHDCPC